MPSCAHHPANVAATACMECLRPICTACYRYEGGQDVCAPCAAKLTRARTVKNVVLAVTAAVIGLLVAGAGAWLAPRMKSPLRYGVQSDEVRALRDRLERQPCDAAAAVKLGDALVLAGASDEVEPMAQAFTARCGRQTQLLWKVYEATKRTGEWDKALAVATDLIEHDPADEDYWWWRGVVHEQLGDLDRALADYQQTLAIRPDVHGIPFNVANLYERLKRPCEAAVTIEQFLHWHPEHRDDVEIRARLERLRREGRCGAVVQGK